MVAPIKKSITMKDIEKLDIRCGTILKVEDIPKSKSLMKLTVDLGEEEPRTILAGIKGEREDPTEIEGKQALFIVNLEPREMMGYTSHGMLFDIGFEDGITPVLAMPEKAVENGVRAG